LIKIKNTFHKWKKISKMVAGFSNNKFKTKLKGKLLMNKLNL
jgi:hypothetical protein